MTNRPGAVESLGHRVDSVIEISLRSKIMH